MLPFELVSEKIKEDDFQLAEIRFFKILISL